MGLRVVESGISPEELKKRDMEAIQKAESLVAELREKLKNPKAVFKDDEYNNYNYSLSFLESNHGIEHDDAQILKDAIFERVLKYGDDIPLTVESYDQRIRNLHFLMLFHNNLPVSYNRSVRAGEIGFNYHEPSSEKIEAILTKIHSLEKSFFEFLEANPMAASAYVENISTSLMQVDRDFAPTLRKNLDSNPSDRSLDFLANVYDKISIDNGPLGKKYYVDIDGVNWELEYHHEEQFGLLVVVKHPNDSGIFAVMSIEKLEGLLTSGELPSFLAQKVEVAARESENSEVLTAYDYPPDKLIGYYRIFPEIYDDITTASLGFSSLLAHQLNQNYPNLQVAPIIFAQKNVAERMKEAVAQGYAQGIRVFHFDIYNHGLEGEGITFYKNLKFADIISQIVTDPEFSDAEFNVSTIACFGGGFRDEFMNLPTESPVRHKVNVFLQATPDAINMAGATSNLHNRTLKEMDIVSTYYNIFLLEALQKGMKYGEAVQYADKKLKQYVYVDSESIIDGTLVENERQGHGFAEAA